MTYGNLNTQSETSFTTRPLAQQSHNTVINFSASACLPPVYAISSMFISMFIQIVFN